MTNDRLSGEALLRALEVGDVRVAERTDQGHWFVHGWVREEILALFRAAHNVVHYWPDLRHQPAPASPASFWDKEGLGPREFTRGEGVRIVPGGTSIRRGAFLGANAIVMPPSYVNVGAFVDEGTMVDSHVLVGSCAQIGKRVHLSAGTQIGGVLEPANARPVIVEDDAFVGGNCGLYEGVLVRSGAVIAAGTVITSGTVVYDLVHQRELRGTREAPLEIPERAVVVPGTRPVTQRDALDLWATHRGLHVACALIVKYRDERTDRATALEDALR